MKKIITLLILMTMILSTIVIADSEIIDNNADMPYNSDITLVVDESGDIYQIDNQPNLFQKIWSGLFGGESENFVSKKASSVKIGLYSCEFSKGAGTFNHPVGKDIKSGSQCSVGQFIIYRSQGGDIPYGDYLFTKAWYKSSSSDMPNFKNYYLNNKNFDYYYQCYNCEISDTSSDEKSCLSKDKSECVKKSDSNCDNDYGYEATCLTKISNDNGGTKPPCLPYEQSGPLAPNQERCPAPSSKTDINLFDIQVSDDGNLIKGQLYTITGKAKITGTCNDCVIETGLNKYGSSFSVLSSSNGACGDDETVGIKVSGSDETISFKLTDKATKIGKYNIPIYAYNGCWYEGKTNHKLYDTARFSVEVVEEPNSIDDDDYNNNDYNNDDDEMDLITCYYCQGDQVRTSTEIGSCLEGQFDYEPSCEIIGDDGPICYDCSGTNVVEFQLSSGETCADNFLSSNEDLDCNNLPYNPCENDIEAPGCEVINNCIDNPDLPYCIEECVGDDCQEEKEWNPFVVVGIMIMFIIILFALMQINGGKKK